MAKSKTSTSSHLANNLSYMMLERDLNPRQLSLKSGLNATAVRDIIEGRSRFPRYDTLHALALTLDTTIDTLMQQSAVASEKQSPPTPKSSNRSFARATPNCVNNGKSILPNVKRPILTKREKEALILASLGKTNDEIAIIFGVSSHTINMHFRHIYEKMDVNNRMFAVVKALVLGIAQD